MLIRVEKIRKDSRNEFVNNLVYKRKVSSIDVRVERRRFSNTKILWYKRPNKDVKKGRSGRDDTMSPNSSHHEISKKLINVRRYL